MKKILVIQTAFVGDVILTTPFLTALAARWSGAEVHVVATPQGAEILAGLSGVTAHPFEKHTGFAALGKILGRLSETEFDLVFCVHRSPRSLWLGRRARASRRVAFASLAARLLGYVTVPYPEYSESTHYSDKPMALLSVFGEVPATPRPALAVTEAESASAVSKAGLAPGEKFVVLSPFSEWGTKVWFRDRFAGVGLEASLKHHVAVVVVGGGGQASSATGESIAATIRAGGGRAVSLVGNTSLGELKALVRGASLVVSNDSAPVHVAAAFDVPTVAVFGPTVEKWGFFPRSTRRKVVERTGLSCRPCGLHGPQTCPKGHFRCMTEITVEEVAKAVEDVMLEPSAR